MSDSSLPSSYFSSKRRKAFLVDTAIYVILSLNAVIVLLPLVFLVLTSFKSLEETLGRLVWFPSTLSLQNYTDVLQIENFYFFRFFFNTMLLFALKTVGTILTCSLAAYGFVRFKYRHKEAIFMVLLSVLMLPGELMTIPMYEIYMNLGWYDTYNPLFVACYFATDIFVLFLFRQFFITIPGELFEAAKIDGASELKIFRKIMLPLSVPVMVTAGILYFTGTYNDIYGPMLYISSEEKFTIAQGIRAIEATFNTGTRDFIIPWNLVSAATVLGLLPILLIFFLAQKQFIEGIATTGIKG